MGEASRRWNAANRPRVNHMQKLRRRRQRAELAAIKMEVGCIDCGYREHPAALDFDHQPGTEKLFNPSYGPSVSRARLLAELAKCDVRCANCHRIITWQRNAEVEEDAPAMA